MIDAGAGPAGHITALGHEPEHYTIFYVEVDDVQAYLDKAQGLGAKTLVPPRSDCHRHVRVVAGSGRQYNRPVEAGGQVSPFRTEMTL